MEWFRGWRCYLELFGERSPSPGTLVRTCFGGLGMGDHAAPDIATAAHEGVIRWKGGLRPQEQLFYRCPLPSAPDGFYEGVVVDDHLGVQKAPRHRWRHWRRTSRARDVEVFEVVNAVYEEVGLGAHEKKKVRREAVFRAWGSEVEGDVGLAGPPRSKLVRLCHVTLSLAILGACSQELLDSLLGL